MGRSVPAINPPPTLRCGPSFAVASGFLDAAPQMRDDERIQAKPQVKVAAATLRGHTDESVADGKGASTPADACGPAPWQAHKLMEFIDASLGSPIHVRVDRRRSGRSPVKIDFSSRPETKDFYDCIEWTATQTWCDGKAGISGISHYSINQRLVAALQPPDLGAI